jgi:hypothetical protein|tara:strand:- start:4441 stop:5370 length:930 start_codon:yes stop_codon:yes gene_type:complete
MKDINEEGAAAYEKSVVEPKPMDPISAAERLIDIKRILDQLGAVFFIASGTCLGAVRDGQFIEWDDEMDMGSVIGLNGLDEKTIDRGITAFEDNGYYVHVDRSSRHIGVHVVKESIRADWTCHRIVGDSVFQYPGVRTPLALFTQLKEIDFIGEKFLVPNPPEKYLETKYGSNWATPKGPGFEEEVVSRIQDGDILTSRQRLSKFITLRLAPWRAGRLTVLDENDAPVSGAEVALIGVGRSKTNSKGHARLYIPEKYDYAISVKYDDHEELLYTEELMPRGTYVYRPGPDVSPEEHYKAGVRAMALSHE